MPGDRRGARWHVPSLADHCRGHALPDWLHVVWAPDALGEEGGASGRVLELLLLARRRLRAVPGTQGALRERHLAGAEVQPLPLAAPAAGLAPRGHPAIATADARARRARLPGNGDG